MRQVKTLVHYQCADTINAGYTGRGIGVVTLDTGIVAHPDFEGRILAFHDVVHNRETVYDDNGHGTHVAGIIGGSGKMSKGLFSGMAPGCNLIAVKVLDEKGNGDISDVIRGINWVLMHRKQYNIQIANISVGTLPHVGNREEQRLVDAVELLWDSGIVVVTAAGNYGPKYGTITTPGISKKVITVGSSNEQYIVTDGARQIKSYSGRGPTWESVYKPDVVAPGSYIISCNGAFSSGERKWYARKSGTSMSTPVVSGTIALLLSKYPDMSNMEVKLRLRGRCDDMGLDQNRQGWGRLNVKRFLMTEEK